jgi:hypothetical protein
MVLANPKYLSMSVKNTHGCQNQKSVHGAGPANVCLADTHTHTHTDTQTHTHNLRFLALHALSAILSTIAVRDCICVLI